MPHQDSLKARAFAPAHITGFFEIHEHKELMKKGSTGCGVVLNGGVYTTTTVSEDIRNTEIILNGEKVAGDTSRAVVEAMTELPVKVESISDIPIGCGFGASGAGALGTAYALNDTLSLNYTARQLNDIAHLAEVSSGSGLGDVTGQTHAGILIRKSPGAPSIASVDWIPSRESEVHCVVLGEMSTKSVLANPSLVKNINEAGREAMKELIRKPSVDNFMLCSRKFSLQSRLADDEVLDVIEAAESVGVTASQAMLGNAVFCIPSPSESAELDRIFTKFGTVMKYNIQTCSIKIS